VSYILDALRKAERERRVSPVPTLDATHDGPSPRRRPAWPWALAGALAVSGVAVVGVWGLWGFWASGPPDSVRQALGPAPSTAGLEAPAKAVPPPPAPQVSLSSARADEGAGQGPVAPAGRPAVSSGPVAPPAAVDPLPTPARAPDGPRGADAARAVRSRDTLADGRTAAPGRMRPPLSGASSEPTIGPRAAAGAAGAGAAPAASPAPATPAASDTTPPAAVPPRLALAPAPPPEAAPGRAAPAGSADALGLTLDVLVYSELPAERLVFINGRKYVEGQAVTADAVVEQITPDGAVLRRADQRIVLRPKLNPYARPGSP
jgi:general secretion pathway protein B